MPTKSKGGSTGVKSRSAITGRYVKPSYAKTHPRTTVDEHDKPKAVAKGKKKR